MRSRSIWVGGLALGGCAFAAWRAMIPFPSCCHHLVRGLAVYYSYIAIEVAKAIRKCLN